MLLAFSLSHSTPTPLYTLSLHDALPISEERRQMNKLVKRIGAAAGVAALGVLATAVPSGAGTVNPITVTGVTACDTRSEEHTSELQSLRHLVCRLLLEKKK